MERIGVRELNQNTSQVLARVSGGETIEITDRGQPVARLVPIGDETSTLARLVASGRAAWPKVSAPFRYLRGSASLGQRGVGTRRDEG